MRKIYSLALMLLLFASVGSRAFSHAHSHDASTGVMASVHAMSHHDEDCNAVVDCDEPHDSNTSNFDIETSHFVLVPKDVLTLSDGITVAECIESESSRRDNRQLSTPSRPPKHS